MKKSTGAGAQSTGTVAPTSKAIDTAVSELSRTDIALFLKIVDQCGTWELWPRTMQATMLSKRLDFSARWKLTTFLLGNRVPPMSIVEWYAARKVLRYKSSWMDVHSIVLQHKTGVLETKGYKYYDCVEGAQCAIVTPWWAEQCETYQNPVDGSYVRPGCLYWTDALDKIKIIAATAMVEPRSKW